MLKFRAFNYIVVQVLDSLKMSVSLTRRSAAYWMCFFSYLVSATFEPITTSTVRRPLLVDLRIWQCRTPLASALRLVLATSSGSRFARFTPSAVRAVLQALPIWMLMLIRFIGQLLCLLLFLSFCCLLFICSFMRKPCFRHKYTEYYFLNFCLIILLT